jgi:5'-nucleotidase
MRSARRVERPSGACYLARRMDTARGPDPAPAAAPVASEAAYDAPAVQALLVTPHRAHPHREVPRARQIFVNRNLRMDKVEAVGFDMDYTVAMYHLQRLETLAFRMTLARMIDARGYPATIGALQYDPEFVIRGLVVDKLHGNIFKMDRHNHVGRVYHGHRPLPEEERRRLYRGEKVHLSSPRFAWIDTLFALPEACLFAGVIELLEAQGTTVDYTKLFDDIRG